MFSRRALFAAVVLLPLLALAGHPYSLLQKFAVSGIHLFMTQKEIAKRLGPPDVIVQRACPPPNARLSCPAWRYEASNSHDNVFRSLYVYFDTTKSDPFVWRVINWELK